MVKIRNYDPRDRFDISVAAGYIERVSHFRLFGQRQIALDNIETDLTLLTPDEIPLPDFNGAAMEIVSTDATDTAVIAFRALGPGGVFLDTFTVTLNGTTPVALPGLISRVNDAFKTGFVDHNGTLSIRAAGGGTEYGRISPDDQRLNDGHFSVPADFNAYIGDLIGTASKGSGQDSGVLFSFRYKHMRSTKWTRSFTFGAQRSGDSSVEISNRYPVELLPGPADLKITASATSAPVVGSGLVSGMLFDKRPKQA